jgi:ectoine hydroxylase-related dioxygenase (phytanoyl-CoA dioxygenase family)
MNINFANEFQEIGFSCIQDALSPHLCDEILKKIETRFADFVHIHQISNAKYFSVVNRWPVDSLLDATIKKRLVEILQPIISNLLGHSVRPYEMDVIYKSPLANRATPCHQDIAYAWKRPYQASSWIPLTDISLSDSQLQFLPGSHKTPIKPAIDFWIPHFRDEFRKSQTWLENAVVPPITRGGAIFFSSKLWHASLPHDARQKRLALVIRWGSKQNSVEKIPLPLPVEFGMWNCGDHTQHLLAAGLKFIKNKSAENFEMLIEEWQTMIQRQELSFAHNIKDSYSALEDLKILEKAYIQYKGGDNQGAVYPRLWLCFLQHLKAYLTMKNAV